MLTTRMTVRMGFELPSCRVEMTSFITYTTEPAHSRIIIPLFVPKDSFIAKYRIGNNHKLLLINYEVNKCIFIHTFQWIVVEPFGSLWLTYLLGACNTTQTIRIQFKHCSNRRQLCTAQFHKHESSGVKCVTVV